jgi:hypothetical protein
VSGVAFMRLTAISAVSNLQAYRYRVDMAVP